MLLWSRRHGDLIVLGEYHLRLRCVVFVVTTQITRDNIFHCALISSLVWLHFVPVRSEIRHVFESGCSSDYWQMTKFRWFVFTVSHPICSMTRKNLALKCRAEFLVPKKVLRCCWPLVEIIERKRDFVTKNNVFEPAFMYPYVLHFVQRGIFLCEASRKP